MVLAAAITLARTPQSLSTWIGIVAFLVASTIAERFPVPLDGVEANGVSLTFVFGVAAIDLFGWAAGVLIVFTAPLVMQIIEHRPPIRILSNAAAFALSGFAAGVAIEPLRGGGDWMLVLRIAVCAFVFYAVNMLLVSSVLALSHGESYLATVRKNVRWTIVPFALMASGSLTLVVLWERSPALSIALVGPLLAIALYQRSTFHALKAMRLALTDPLTGLGNHRHFHERLQQRPGRGRGARFPSPSASSTSTTSSGSTTASVIPSGDRVLAQVATRLRQGGEAFRLGGDEFAVLLPGHGEDAALAAGNSIVDRIAGDEARARRLGHGQRRRSPPSRRTGVGRDELIRLADSALYWAKERGKNRVRVYRPDVVELAELKRLAAGPDRPRATAPPRASPRRSTRATPTPAATRSASASSRRGSRAALGAERRARSSCTGSPASLHDLGKLAIPEEILRKPGPLTDPSGWCSSVIPRSASGCSRASASSRSPTGCSTTTSAGTAPATPTACTATTIPLGARIIFVADAYDAMTSERVYRGGSRDEHALRELERCAGTQFDPEVVEAFEAEVAEAGAPERDEAVRPLSVVSAG